MQRSSGILLHLTSLPSVFPVGDLGESAINFIDFLSRAGQSVWQVLPLGPTGFGHSPYNALSAFAGNPVVIDLSQLVEHGDLEKATLDKAGANLATTSFAAFHPAKLGLLQMAGRAFFANKQTGRHEDFQNFCAMQKDWLDDFSLFMAIKNHFDGQPWYQWPTEIRERRAESLDRLASELQNEIALISYQQFVFAEQWRNLHDYARKTGVRIFGDIPIFVAYDSADVWANQHLFQLDQSGKPLAVAGVPPDYFSKAGQRWGNPLYRWEAHLADNFSWWTKRFRHQLTSCDLVRIDHFRGFQACWSIPANEKTAVNGHWEDVPGRQLFIHLQHLMPELPIIAEDLGVITADVEKLRDDFGFPGMKILQFAFDSGPDNPYLPENHNDNSVVYSGTHDNDTTLGWWQKLSSATKLNIRDYLGTKRPDMPWALIELAMSSTANLCIIPCQDILALDSSARFNTPGKATGNWQWQLPHDQLTHDLAARLRQLAAENHRLPER